MYPCNNEKCPLLEIKLIPLQKGEYAIVDSCDYDLLMKFKWRKYKGNSTMCYVGRSVRASRQNEYICDIHRMILECKKHDGILVDHKNHNTLDNRRCNLRKCTQSQNQANQIIRKRSSKYRGASWDKKNNKWVSCIKYKRKIYSLGRFDTEEEAAIAYNKKAIEFFGEFANVNILSFSPPQTDGLISRPSALFKDKPYLERKCV